MTDMTIRPARHGDEAIISKMIHELAVYERAPEECHATPEAIAEQLFGRKPTAEALMAEYKGEPAAYAIFFHNFSTWEAAPGLYLEDLYVRPTYRRMGIGRMLLAALASIALERGCKRYEWAVLDWNKPARDFYEALGARPMTEWVIHRTEGEALARLAAEGEKLRREMAPLPEIAPVPEGKTVVIHTDGGAQPNPGTGGWAAVIRVNGEKRELSGGEPETTNNRMEMTAAIRALEALGDSPRQVELHTDSTYLRNGITQWIAKWKRNGWRTTTGAVKNEDLWRKLDSLCAFHRVEWHWLRGHAGDEDNELCDELCSEAIERVRKG